MRIIIEIDDQELKGLIFEDEKRQEKQETNYGRLWSKGYGATFDNRYVPLTTLRDMKEIALTWGMCTLEDYKDLVDLKGPRTFTDHKVGWTFNMLCEALVKRDGLRCYIKLPEPVSVRIVDND